MEPNQSSGTFLPRLKVVHNIKYKNYYTASKAFICIIYVSRILLLKLMWRIRQKLKEIKNNTSTYVCMLSYEQVSHVLGQVSEHDFATGSK